MVVTSHLLFPTSPFDYVSSMLPAVCSPAHFPLRSPVSCSVCFSAFFSACFFVCCSVCFPLCCSVRYPACYPIYSSHLQPPSYPLPSSRSAHRSPQTSYPDNSPSGSPGTAALTLLAFAAEASVAVLIESVSMQAAA